MLGHSHPDLRNIEHLLRLDTDLECLRQPLPQLRQALPSCRTSLSGTGACVFPGCPFCPPTCERSLPSSDFGAALTRPSDEGGFDEFVEFLPSCAFNSVSPYWSPGNWSEMWLEDPNGYGSCSSRYPPTIPYAATPDPNQALIADEGVREL
ncbi:MAG: hypothetical protein JWL97_4016 [Gemmatimonadales bacterium]|jgi:hypothetical protein|nr:hypothetical protein [Gemmatimonadales bacterium]